MKKLVAGLLALVLAILPINIMAAPTTLSKTVTPNKLTIEWADKRSENVTIDTFRTDGYNVAQLRSLVAACGGTVVNVDDGSYQITTGELGVKFDTIKFDEPTTVKVQYNVTTIRDPAGNPVKSASPAWVYLVDYEYNCGGLRDILGALGLEIAETDDKPEKQTTHVVVRPIANSSRPTPGVSPTATPTPTVPPSYDLRSKPLGTALPELKTVLDEVDYYTDSQGRTVISGKTKAVVSFSYDSYSWIASYDYSYQQLVSGTRVPEGIYLLFTYIGTGPTLSPTPTPTASPTPTAAPSKRTYNFQDKSNLQVYDDIDIVLGSAGFRFDGSGRFVLFGVTNGDITFRFNYLTWIGSAGTPLASFSSGKEIPYGTYVEFAYIPKAATPTPTPTSTPTPSPSPLPTPSATPSPTPTPEVSPTLAPTPTPTLAPPATPTPTVEPSPTLTPTPAPTPTSPPVS